MITNLLYLEVTYNLFWHLLCMPSFLNPYTDARVHPNGADAQMFCPCSPHPLSHPSIWVLGLVISSSSHLLGSLPQAGAVCWPPLCSLIGDRERDREKEADRETDGERYGGR